MNRRACGRMAAWALMVFGVCATGRSATLITFDTDAFGNPLAAPALFLETTALRDLYAPLGVHFLGPSALDGGAILNASGGFGVPALSGSNFLAFNTTAVMADGGIARGPETVLFDEAQFEVSFMLAGGFLNETFVLSVYDETDQLLGSQEHTVFDWRQIRFQIAGIRKLVIAPKFSPRSFVIEDLYFDAFVGPGLTVPEPASGVLLAIGAGVGVAITLSARRRASAPRPRLWARRLG